MDGLGALPEEILIQLKNGRSKTRTLVLAPRADEHAIARALRCGASGVLGRGEGIANLLPALTTVASGQAWARRQAIARALEGVPRETAAQRQALTPREREILAMLGDGYRNKELAVLLKIKEQTVKIHLHSLFKKLHVRSRVEAALKSIELFDAPQDPSEAHRARRRSG
jgi:DNA-binding NarL/FixJ family response regulator